MQFNYPVSYDPKKFLVTPYITDNFMSLNSKCGKTLRSWFDTNYKGEDPILQFSLDSMLLKKFNLAGIEVASVPIKELEG